MLKIDIVTLFPKMFQGPLSESLLSKAQTKNLVQIELHDLRDYSNDKHRKVDAKEFGGGPGMLIKVEPLFQVLKKLSAVEKNKNSDSRPWVIYLSPQGKKLNQKTALELSKKKHLVLICGHYEGIDERAMEWIDEEISIGDYVLTGGELPAMVLTDTVSRLVPGVVKEWGSIENDSFFNSLLDYSHYTRPQTYQGKEVPETLVSGNHKEIERWRENDSIKRTQSRRPDLLQ